MKEVTKKNHFLIKVDTSEEEGGLKKEGSIFIPVEAKNFRPEYQTAEIIKVSTVISEEYIGIYNEGDKIMIHPNAKGNEIGEYRYVPVDVIFGKI